MQLHQHLLAAATAMTTVITALPIGGQDAVGMIVAETSKQVNNNAPLTLDQLNKAADRILSRSPAPSVGGDPLAPITEVTDLVTGALKSKRIGGQDPVGFIVDETSKQVNNQNPEAGEELDEALGRVGLVPDKEGEPHISTMEEEKRYDGYDEEEEEDEWKEEEKDWQKEVDKAKEEYDEDKDYQETSDPIKTITGLLGSGLGKRLGGVPLPLEAVEGAVTGAVSSVLKEKRQLIPTLQGDSALSAIGGSLLGRVVRRASDIGGLDGVLGSLGLGGGSRR